MLDRCPAEEDTLHPAAEVALAQLRADLARSPQGPYCLLAVEGVTRESYEALRADCRVVECAWHDCDGVGYAAFAFLTDGNREHFADGLGEPPNMWRADYEY
ncbi:MAG: hypothetical protein GC129_00335 [Proteobacteria bacterium]|nr:hypothetical protein [Pseudomonadota bacterium]